MRRLVPLVFLTSLILSCNGHRPVDTQLKQADCLMLHHPDSSLAILQGIDRNSLGKESQRACYSLLLSEALDRNSIYVKSDSLILPALDYYKYHGNQGNKLKVCYYMACIAYNAGDREAAMEWLARGEERISQANDLNTTGLLYQKKSAIYKELMDYESALDNDLKASSYLKENEYFYKYAQSQIALADDYLNLDQLDAADRALDVLLPSWDSIAYPIRARYLKTRIGIATERQDTAYVQYLKNACFSEIPDASLRPWLAISDAHVASGKLDSALIVLGRYADFNPEALDRNYYMRLAGVYEQLGDFQTAYDMQNKAIEESSTSIMEVMNSDTRFMEERYKTQITQLRQQRLAISLIAALAILLLIGYAVYRYSRKSLKKTESSLTDLTQRYDLLKKERDTLEAAQKESDIMNEEARKMVGERLALLDKVLLGHITSNPVDSKAAEQSIHELLKNKDQFIISTAAVFATSHPKFVAFLKEHELTKWEIGYCCLFLMGLYSKDLEPHFSKASSNNYNKIIRNKLGLPMNGPKLKTYLLETCKELED